MTCINIVVNGNPRTTVLSLNWRATNEQRKINNEIESNKMTADELYKKVVGQLPIKELHPLHKAIMEECCENAINNPKNVTNLDTLVYAVQVAFLTCNSTLQGTLQASLNMADADQVTLNYRGQIFIIPKNSSLLK